MSIATGTGSYDWRNLHGVMPEGGGSAPVDKVEQRQVEPKNWPVYRSHKLVQAARIAKVELVFSNDQYAVELEGGKVIHVPWNVFARGVADPGDYLVSYSDGYLSWSPSKAFEEGYTAEGDPLEPGLEQAGTGGLLSFGQALALLRKGYRVGRDGWNGKGMWLILVKPDAPLSFHGPLMAGSIAAPFQLPWIGMRTADGKFVPWLASQSDMLAEDWARVIFPNGTIGGPLQTPAASLPAD